MRALATDVEDGGGAIVLQTDVRNIARLPNELFQIDVVSGGAPEKITARHVIAAAGLGMADLGSLLPHAPDYHPPTLYFAKGHYFSLRGKPAFRHLVYPVPVDGGLGIHLTLDIDGGVRFGPDVEWVERIDYSFNDPDGIRQAEFERCIRRYWPGLPDNALTPGFAGIRPKVSRRGEPAADFAIHGPRQHGIPRLVTLYGIESPGLTSSLAIAAHCRMLLNSH
jgi:L-2-hydroxyglutarate oxidase LhgO